MSSSRTFRRRLGDSRTVSLLVGRSVAVVLVDGTIVGALNLLSTTRVSLSSVGDSLELDDVGAGASPTWRPMLN